MRYVRGTALETYLAAEPPASAEVVARAFDELLNARVAIARAEGRSYGPMLADAELFVNTISTAKCVQTHFGSSLVPVAPQWLW